MTPSEKPSENAATGAGRGLVFISFAKLWFMVAGYAIQFGLPRALGDAAKFGVWTLVLSLVSPLNNVLVTANIQSVSRFSSAGDGKENAVLRAGLRLQSYVAAATWLLFVGAAPLIAWFEHDMSLLPTLWLASGVILAYSFYAVFVGAANGTRQFHKQAALDIMFSTMRASFVIGAAWLTHSVLASVGGFVAAAGTILVISYFLVGLGPRPTESVPLRPIANFFAALAGYLLVQNLIMFVDSYLLKRAITEAAAAAGAVDPVHEADTTVGYYGAVQAIARLPYQLILAVTFVIFPLMSKATFDDDKERSRRYVEMTMRYSLLVLVVFAGVLGSRPLGTLNLLYKPEYGVGATALPVLIVGYIGFALLAIGGTVLNSAGNTRRTSEIAGATVVLASLLAQGALWWAKTPGRDPLFAIACAAATAMIFGSVWTLIELRRFFGATLRLLWVARTALVGATAVVLGRFWPSTGFLGGKLGSLLYFCVCGVVCLVVAVGSGELNVRELLAARRKN